MTLSQTNVIAQVRDLIDEATGFARIYASSETEEHAIPPALNEYPSVIVIPGPTTDYKLTTGQQRHSYEVKVLVFCNEGGDLGQSAAQASPLVDAIIAKFEANVTLGARANYCLFSRSSGLVTLEYAGLEYLGWEIVLNTSEQAPASPAVGS